MKNTLAPTHSDFFLSYAPQFHLSSQDVVIFFEGIEGCGKSTQIGLWEDYLASQQIPYLSFREPGGTSFGEELRRVILAQKKTSPLNPLAEVLLFSSARAQLYSHLQSHRPMNSQARVILYDRSWVSTLAYQGLGRGVPLDVILNIHSVPPLSLLPHMICYFQLSWETSVQRVKQRRSTTDGGDAVDYFEQEEKAFFTRVHQGFETIRQWTGLPILTINAEQRKEEVWKESFETIDRLIRRHV